MALQSVVGKPMGEAAICQHYGSERYRKAHCYKAATHNTVQQSRNTFCRTLSGK